VHLLLIDDHALFREGLKFLLRGLDQDLAIDEAGSVDAAAARRETAYDLVLLDLNLPGVGHLEALASIREAFPQAPVVVLSGEGDTFSSGAPRWGSLAPWRPPTMKC